jgi:hypothetical protein
VKANLDRSADFGIASALMLGVAVGGVISMFIIVMFLI